MTYSLKMRDILKKDILLIFFSIFIFSFFSCASTNFVIDDLMMEPVIDEMFDQMDKSIMSDWTERKRKPSVIIVDCYDERYGTGVVTTISNWTKNKLIRNFIESKHYYIVDDEDLEQIRNQRKFQQAGFVDDKVLVDEAREMGGNYYIKAIITSNSVFELKATNVAYRTIVYSDFYDLSKRRKKR